MACLIPKRIVNPHYKKISPDRHFLLYNDISGLYPKKDYYIDVACGRCINCFKKYMSSWRFRLLNEILSLSSSALSKSYYVTLTIEPKYYSEKKAHLKVMVRRFLDRCRKRYGHSVRHFLVTERGEEKQRLHFHGFFINTDVPPNMFYQLWHYGFVSIYPIGDRGYSISQEVSYCTTYITKGKKGRLPDVLTPEDVPLVLVSPGMGKSYVNRKSSFHQSTLLPFAYDFTGKLRSLPRYYRLKVFTEQQLKDMKDQYFDNLSDDVIPDGPYYIGERVYNDYTQYLRDSQKFKQIYNQIYGKQFSRSFSGALCERPEES